MYIACQFQPALASVEGYANNTSMQSTTRPWIPVPGNERVNDQGGSSGQLGLRAGGAKNLWVKMSRRKRVSRLDIATYNVTTLLTDKHIQELEEELKKTRLVWDVIGIGEVRRRQECFTILQSGHLLHLYKTNNDKAFS